MSEWMRRTRGAVGIGVTWAVAWAVAGIMIGASSNVFPGLPWDAFFEVFDAPLPALAIPGFIGGAIFSLVLGIAGRRRRFDELSLPKFAAWGALGGLLVCLIPALAASLGALTGGSIARIWQAIAVISGPFILLGAASAAGSLALARRAERGQLLEGAERVGERLGEGSASGASHVAARASARNRDER